jgi:hypothetical protein
MRDVELASAPTSDISSIECYGTKGRYQTVQSCLAAPPFSLKDQYPIEGLEVFEPLPDTRECCIVVLRMPCPTKRSGSDNCYYRRTIPADVQTILQKLPKERRPRGWYKTHISISLGTADRSAAKAKCPEIAATVERKIKALREGPKPLSAKQVSALSGIVYRAFAEGLENNPGLTANGWQQVARANRLAQQGKLGLGARLGIYRDDDERRDADMEQRFGGLVDATLVREGVVADVDSRWLVIQAAARDLTEAAKKLARNTEGDYSPDTYANRFPPPSDLRASKPSGQTLTGLAEAWHTQALAREMNARSAKRWKAVALRFQKWLGHDDLSRVTSDRVQAWGDDRNAEGIAAKTINDTDFSALRAMFGRGKKRGWLSSNPALEAKIEARRKRVTREKYFAGRDFSNPQRGARCSRNETRVSNDHSSKALGTLALCLFRSTSR